MIESDSQKMLRFEKRLLKEYGAHMHKYDAEKDGLYETWNWRRERIEDEDDDNIGTEEFRFTDFDL